MNLTRPLLVGFLALAAPAFAATPESGEVSSATPKVEWKGTAGGYGYSVVADRNEAFPPCEAPACDQFALTVKDQADLVVSVTTDDGTGFTTMEVEDPDGKIHYNGGAEGEPTSLIKIKKAKPGAYVVRAATNNPPGMGDAYSAAASLAVSPAATAPPAPTQPSQPSQPGQPSQPAATPTEAPIISVKPGKLSARKAKRKLAVGLSSSGRVSGLTATLLKGAKIVGKGKLATLNGSGKITLKVKRLKKGKYTFRVSGKSDAGNVVATQVNLKIGR
jgi:hypothetical protein